MKWIWHFPKECFYLDYFVNPIPALAMLVMALNDHWLKYTHPSWVTGKLSDFCGVFYFPLFLCAAGCLGFNYLIRPFLKARKIAYISPRSMTFAMVITALLMVTIKMNSNWAHAVELAFSDVFFTIQLTPDPSDLVSLLSLPLSYLYARQFFARPF